jgi:hypothetical protein
VPVLLSAANNVARFDHNPVTGESLGLLIEEQRTNLLTYSEQFDNAAWTKTRSSITANTIVAPDGTLTGDKLVEDTTASNTHVTNQVFSFSTGSYVYSIYAKAGERTFLQPVRSGTNIDAFTHIFNLTTGTASGTGATIVAVGNGWYRCIGVINVNTAHSGSILFGLNNGTTITYTGDGYSGIYIWGAQLEAGAFPTSYIPTVASQVTRSADAASMTGANFSSWYNAAEGTLYAEGSVGYTVPATFFPYLAALNDGASNNRIDVGYVTTSVASFEVTANAVSQVAIFQSASGLALRKVAGGYKTNDFAASTNGLAASTDTSGVLPSVDRLRIGDRAGASTLNGHIRKIAYYPKRLANAELQGLTTV